MTRRRQPKPGPTRDWRALAEPTPLEPSDGGPDDVRMTLRTQPDGTRVVLLVAAVAFVTPDNVRLVARQLMAAAEALEGSSS